LDLVPHSIRVFLETVNHGLWDNTVFWHHDDIDHVISSATVVYSTGMPNHHYFDALGLRGVSFAEYSSEFPHTKYSLGFANRGPVFYINTMDNTDLHGPGGQGHHDLPDEADPCFGRVVLGFDVVDEMLKLSLEPKTEQGEHRDWHQYDLTHIKSAEILHEW
jgi:cyclophilin family peptidyl-prolyl cis-trans isomerase